MKVSDCCGAGPRNDYEEEGGMCSSCGEHCTYEEEYSYTEDEATSTEIQRRDWVEGIYKQMDQEDANVESFD